MVRKGPVGFHQDAFRIDVLQQRQNRRQGVTGNSIGCVDRNLDGSLDVGKARHMLGIVIQQVDLLSPTAPGGRWPLGPLAGGLDLGNAGSLGNGLGPATAELHAIVFPGVVTGGHAQASGHISGTDGKVGHGGRCQADIDHIGPGTAHTCNHRIRDLGRVHAHVAPHEER